MALENVIRNTDGDLARLDRENPALNAQKTVFPEGISPIIEPEGEKQLGAARGARAARERLRPAARLPQGQARERGAVLHQRGRQGAPLDAKVIDERHPDQAFARPGEPAGQDVDRPGQRSGPRGTRYVVKTQILNVEEFDKRVVSNVARTYTGQADATQQYPELDDVVGVTICEFELWPRRELPHVPLLNRFHMGQLLFVFLELPKLDTSRPPQSTIEKWAYFFREASNLAMVPEALTERPFVDALNAARVAHFTDDEWDAYIRVGMAIQDERGALSFARKEGARTELRAALRLLLDARGLSPDAALDARIDAETDLDTLRRWHQQAISAPTAAEALK